MHGLRYIMWLVGDGDSSVLHAITTMPSNVIGLDIYKDNPSFRGKGGLTKAIIKRIAVGVCSAIKYHKNGDVADLRHDQTQTLLW